MRVYTVHTDRNSITYETLATALRVVAFHHKVGGWPQRPIYVTSHVTPFPAR